MRSHCPRAGGSGGKRRSSHLADRAPPYDPRPTRQARLINAYEKVFSRPGSRRVRSYPSESLEMNGGRTGISDTLRLRAGVRLWWGIVDAPIRFTAA